MRNFLTYKDKRAIAEIYHQSELDRTTQINRIRLDCRGNCIYGHYEPWQLINLSDAIAVMKTLEQWQNHPRTAGLIGVRNHLLEHPSSVATFLVLEFYGAATHLMFNDLTLEDLIGAVETALTEYHTQFNHLK